MYNASMKSKRSIVDTMESLENRINDTLVDGFFQ